MELPIAYKQVLLMSGLPGSGKSKLAHRIKDLYFKSSLSCIVLSADDFFIKEDGLYHFDKDALGKAHKDCWKKFYSALSLFNFIIVDNTNLVAAEVAPYVLPAEVHDFSVRIVRVLCKPAEAFKRQQHGVPEKTYKKMIRQWEKRDVLSRWAVSELASDAEVRLSIQQVNS